MKKRKLEEKKNIKVSEYLRESGKEIQERGEEFNIEIPQQAQFYKTPVRFGNIPVDTLPLGCDIKEQYRKIYPKISLPFQTTERISLGHKDLEPNQLIFGDNLHVMRALPSNSIDLIYIDPPFFSGRDYNVVFGDSNEVRSFTDIWEGGMPGYLTWLNARLLEMKRLLKPTGTILVHCDWHAGHYIKTELDKIFGYDKFINEIIWKRHVMVSGASGGMKRFSQKNDTLLLYSKTKNYTFNIQYNKIDDEEKLKNKFKHFEEETKRYFETQPLVLKGNEPSFLKFPEKEIKLPQGLRFAWNQNTLNKNLDKSPNIIYWTKTGLPRYKKYVDDFIGESVSNLWDDINVITSKSNEAIGYPTQKPEALLKRIIETFTNKGDVVADFFCGGGTTPAVAQKLGRRWIASDISNIAISVTRDRILRDILGKNGNQKEVQNTLGKTPDIEIKSWGIYEVPELVKLNEESFRNFIISAYNGRLTSLSGLIHGYKQSVPIFVGSPSQEKPITEKEVVEFSKHIIKSGNYHQGTMIGWGFTPGARNVAQQLIAQHSIAIDFVKLQLIPIESNEFKEHITSKHPEYKNLLKFILPPEVRISQKRMNPLEYEFDVSESVSLNPSGKIINVQWDFSYNGERFISTAGYSFLGMKNKKPVLKINYKFKTLGKNKIACKVQDDEGGEKIEIMEINVK